MLWNQYVKNRFLRNCWLNYWEKVTFFLKLIKQTDGCLIGSPVSVVFADIYICKMKDDAEAPINPIINDMLMILT